MSAILIVDDEEGMRKSLAILFKREGYRVYEADSGAEAIRQMASSDIALVITDMRMDGMTGTDVLDYANQRTPKIPVIIMTGYGTIESAVSTMKMGAYDYITKPFEYEEIVHRSQKAIQTSSTDEEMMTMRHAKGGARMDEFPMIVGKSRIMSDIKAQLRKIAVTDLPVLITGETGTGKNLLAKAIHLNSSRYAGPFTLVNCASIPEHLFESELFGHTRGAFTGAIMERKGLFETADKGTILLDEIGLIPRTIQAKLLGVLQDSVVRKVGSDREITVDVRVMAATNTDLLAATRKGEFREDLFYRLNVLSVHVPPLRQHREDIFALSEHFLSLCRSEQGKQDVVGFGPDVMDRLYNYDFPGNVRELSNIVCRAVALADSTVISCEDLPITPESAALPPLGNGETMDMMEWERRIILESIKRHPNNLAEVCKELRIGRTTLWRKMKKYHISFEHGSET